MTDDILLGLGAMATRAGVPRGWLRDEALAGRIPHLAAGGRMLFLPSAVEPLLLERARTGNSASPSSAAAPGEQERDHPAAPREEVEPASRTTSAPEGTADEPC